MNHTLIIQSEDGKEVVRVSIGEIEPLGAALLVMTALRNTKPRRSDAGKPRKPKEVAA